MILLVTEKADGGLSLKFLVGSFLIIGGICGMVISLLGKIVISSHLAIINGLELSSGIGLFSIIAILSGMYILIFERVNA